MRKEEEGRGDECLNTSMRIFSDLPNSNHLLLLRTAVRRSWTAEICSGGLMNRKKDVTTTCVTKVTSMS